MWFSVISQRFLVISCDYTVSINRSYCATVQANINATPTLSYLTSFRGISRATLPFNVYWWDHISSVEVLQRSGLPTISDISSSKYCLMVTNHESRKPSADWIRPPGRPRRTRLNLVQEYINAIPLSTLWIGELRLPWVMDGATVRDNDDDDDDDDNDGLPYSP